MSVQVTLVIVVGAQIHDRTNQKFGEGRKDDAPCEHVRQVDHRIKAAVIHGVHIRIELQRITKGTKED